MWLLLVLTVSCVAGGQETAPPPTVPSSSAAGACSSTTSEQIVRQFVGAFDGRDFESASRSLSDVLQWFSADLNGTHEVAYGKTEVMRYLRARASAGDSMRLTSLRVTDTRQWDDSFGFSFTLALVRDQTSYGVIGKGAVSCWRIPGISVWSMGGTS